MCWGDPSDSGVRRQGYVEWAKLDRERSSASGPMALGRLVEPFPDESKHGAVARFHAMLPALTGTYVEGRCAQWSVYVNE